MLGYDRDELLAMSYSELLDADLESARQNVDRILQDKLPVICERRLRKKNGQSIGIEIVAGQVEVGGRQLIMLNLHDLTERRRLEQEREQYWRFFHLATDPMCILDADDCFTQVNTALVKMSGHAETELLGRSFLDFVLQDDRRRNAEDMKLQACIRPSPQFENRWLCKDGAVTSLAWTAHLEQSDGITYAMARDITALKRSEVVLMEAHALIDEVQQLSKLGGWRYDCASGRVAWTDEVL